MLRFTCLMLALCFATALFFGLPVCRAAEPLIVLQDAPVKYNIGSAIYLLEDPTGSLTINQVQQQRSSFLKSRQEAPVYGPSSSAVWCYFRVQNQSQEAKWYLEIGSSFLYEVDLYREQAPGRFKLLRGGAGQPFQNRRLKTNRLILLLHLPVGAERTFYVRFRSRSILRFPLQIATMPALYETNHRADVINGIYFGLLFALMMYNLFVYFSLRDKAYLYYVLFIFTVAAEIACIRGYLHEWWPEPFMWQVNTRIFLGLALLFSLLFTNAILQVKQNLPRLYRWRWIVAACLSLVLLLNLLGFYVWSFTHHAAHFYSYLHIRIRCGYTNLPPRF